MEDPSPDLRTRIIDAALTLYIEDRNRFTLRSIADKAGCELAEVQQEFPGKQAILRAFYDQIPDVYRESTVHIPEYESLNFGEKASNYIYTTFDVLSAHRDFTEETFAAMVLNRRDTHWHTESAALFRSFIQDDSRIPGANTMVIPDFVYPILVGEYLQLIRFWLQDDSPGTERTLALVDKLTVFANELVYSGIIDKGFDLVKYLAGNDIWKFRFQGITQDAASFAERIQQTGMELAGDLKHSWRRVEEHLPCDRSDWGAFWRSCRPSGFKDNSTRDGSVSTDLVKRPESIEIPIDDDPADDAGLNKGASS